MAKTEIVSWNELDEQVRREWNAIVDRHCLNPTLRPQWMEIATTAVPEARQGLCCMVLTDDYGARRGFFPFYRSRRGPTRLWSSQLNVASNAVSYHTELVADDASSLLRSALEVIPGWDILEFANVCLHGPTASAIADVAEERRMPMTVLPGEASPYISIQGSWEELIAGKGKKFRYKLRKRREALEQNPAIRVVTLEHSDDVPRLLSSIHEIEARSWKADRGIDIASRPGERAYYEALLPFLARRGCLWAQVLYVSGDPVAYGLCCLEGGWMGLLKTSFDRRFAGMSPGAVVADACIEHAHTANCHEFDFLGDSDKYKLSWSTGVREHANFYLSASTARARVLGTLKGIATRFGNRRIPSASTRSGDDEN